MAGGVNVAVIVFDFPDSMKNSDSLNFTLAESVVNLYGGRAGLSWAEYVSNLQIHRRFSGKILPRHKCRWSLRECYPGSKLRHESSDL